MNQGYGQLCEESSSNKSNAKVEKYARQVNLRGNNVIIGNQKGVHLVYKIKRLVCDLNL